MRVVDLHTLHLTRVCPAKGQLCAKCGKRGHWAACYRNEADGNRKLSKSDGRGSENNNWRSCGATSERNLKPRANKLIKWTTTSKRKNLPSQLTTMGKGPVNITFLGRRLL